jgi:hypothetical protein
MVRVLLEISPESRRSCPQWININHETTALCQAAFPAARHEGPPCARSPGVAFHVGPAARVKSAWLDAIPLLVCPGERCRREEKASSGRNRYDIVSEDDLRAASRRLFESIARTESHLEVLESRKV